MPDHQIQLSKLRCLNLDDGSILSAEDRLAIARLIYHTDPYIYPAMFGSRETAEALIPLLFDRHDSMFRLSNCFVTVLDSRIIGLILWVRGALNWSPELLRELSRQNGFPVSPYLDMVAEEYVDSYRSEEKQDTVFLINVSVLDQASGRGVGRMMLGSFLRSTAAGAYELCVLQDNTRAVKLYRSFGFSVAGSYNGFSTDRLDLPAYRMQRGKWEK